jgi:hypothetical protein
MKPKCEYFPMTFGDYEHPAPDPVMCGEPAEMKLRVTYFNEDGSVDRVEEAYSCRECFAEALNNSGHLEYDDNDEIILESHDPSYGPKFEVLERL